jgi:hypothetical protein
MLRLDGPSNAARCVARGRRVRPSCGAVGAPCSMRRCDQAFIPSSGDEKFSSQVDGRRKRARGATRTGYREWLPLVCKELPDPIDVTLWSQVILHCNPGFPLVADWNAGAPRLTRTARRNLAGTRRGKYRAITLNVGQAKAVTPFLGAVFANWSRTTSISSTRLRTGAPLLARRPG